MPIARTSTAVKRVKSGCVTCRIRRVKCDETKPECNRCSSTGRKCDGYISLPFSRRDLHSASGALETTNSSRVARPVLRIITDPAFNNLLEKRYFQFFRQRTVSSTNSLIDSRFWDRICLQACHSEPAVRHAVLALSSLHQIAETRDDPGLAVTHQEFAEQQYQKALIAAQTLIAGSRPQDVDLVLIACVIFICFESVRGNYQASQMHTSSGRSILAQHRERLGRPDRQGDLKEIRHLFGRLDVSALTFSDSTAPYPYKLPHFLDTNPNLQPDAFDSIEDAREPLIDHIRWLLVIGRHADEAYQELPGGYSVTIEETLIRCVKHLKRWRERFLKVKAMAQDPNTLLVLTLEMWYYTCRVFSEVGLSGPEVRYDRHVHCFRKIVSCGEQIVALLGGSNGADSFGFDLGYTAPTFMTVQRCRDPSVRRRALAVLRAQRRQEGAWATDGAAEVAAQWMQFEEEGLREVKTVDDIPEWKRISAVNTTIDTEQGHAQVVYRMSSLGLREGRDTSMLRSQFSKLLDNESLSRCHRERVSSLPSSGSSTPLDDVFLRPSLQEEREISMPNLYSATLRNEESSRFMDSAQCRNLAIRPFSMASEGSVVQHVKMDRWDVEVA